MFKRTIFLVVLFVLVVTLVSIAEEYDFRSVNWGMSVEEVKENEIAKTLTEENNIPLEYLVELEGYQFKLSYSFNENNQLYKAVYEINEDNLDPIWVSLRSGNIKEKLLRKYTYDGKLSNMTFYKSDKTDIVLTQSDYYISIIYVNNKYAPTKKEVNNNNSNNQL